MNISPVMTKHYEQKQPLRQSENKAKTNPIKTNLRKAKMNLSSVKTKEYVNELPLRPPAKQSQFQTQSKPILLTIYFRKSL